MTDGGIKITGAKELRKVLRDMAERSPREMQWANFVTADMVADRIKARMRMAFRAWPRGNRRHPTVPLPDSVVAKATTARAIVEAGGPKSPHFHPHNFGGTIARFHSQARTKVEKHETVYSTLAEEEESIIKTYETAVNRIIKEF